MDWTKKILAPINAHKLSQLLVLEISELGIVKCLEYCPLCFLLVCLSVLFCCCFVFISFYIWFVCVVSFTSAICMDPSYFPVRLCLTENTFRVRSGLLCECIMESVPPIKASRSNSSPLIASIMPKQTIH